MAKSFTQLTNQFLTLSLNSNSANSSLAGTLLNDQHRYLLLKYFDNERSTTMLTIGPQTLTLTAPLAIGALTGTLSTVWPNISSQQLVTMSTTDQRTVFFTQGSATISWISPLTAATTTSINALGVQAYPLPANVSKIKNSTITIGQLVYTPYPIQSIQEWTKLNALPYAASYPAYFYLYNNQLNFFPVPSISGEIITLYCQISVADMTYADYSTGTLATMTVGSNTVTGSGTGWTTYPQNTDLTFANLYLTATPPNGDGLPYQIQSFSSGTTATLIKPVVNAPNENGTGSYVIGQYPLLSPDFHDTIVYGALRIYFSSIRKDPDLFKLYEGLFNERLELMKFYLSTKSVNVDLGSPVYQRNPNLFPNPVS